MVFPEEQRRIIARIEELAAKIEEARGLRRETVEEVSNVLAAFITHIFSGEKASFWQEGQLGDYILDDCYGTSEKTLDDPTGIPILRMGNIQNGRILTTELKYLYLDDRNRDKQILKKGDILVNRTNSAELVGKCAVFDLEGDYGFASYIIRLRIDQAKANPWLIAAYINSPLGRKYIFQGRTLSMQQQERQTLAAEVLEMGEQLFSLALEAQDSPHTTPGEEMQDQAHQAFPHAEIAAASAEFFAALRLLFGITD